MRADKNNWTDKAATKLAGVIHTMQLKFVKVMNKFFGKVPKRKMQIMVIAFCVLSGGFSGYLFTRSIVNGQHEAMKIEDMQVPSHIIMEDSISNNQK